MSITHSTDSSYPVLLHHAKGAPAALFYEGDLEACSAPCISVIGSRSMSGYGQQVVQLLVPGLVKAGLTIVSGLAYGIDSYAHRVALRQKGLCVAVLGSSLDRIYPRVNEQLAKDIVSNGGCIFSEYPPGTDPERGHFPERNRIVAGLSPVTLIIEAGEKSGTLITARQALDAGREVCVVPADITREQSKGTHQLLKQGARPVTSVEDVILLYGKSELVTSYEPLRPALTGSLATLYDLISCGVETLDALIAKTGWSLTHIQSLLTVLELDGYIFLKNNQWLKTY